MSAQHSLKQPASARDLLGDIKVVDADTHVSEWHDLWTSRAPRHLRHRVPQVRDDAEGFRWVIDGTQSLGAVCAASAVRKDGYKAVGAEFLAWRNADVDPASYDLAARLERMDAEGIYAQIAYPNVLGFGGQKAMMVDPELRLLSTRIFNDAMAEMQAQSNDRIYPMALLPWWDPALAVEEAGRCNDMGLRGVNINPDPHMHGLPPLGHDAWDPLWKTCCDRGMPINFHIGASDESMSWFASGQWPARPDGRGGGNHMVIGGKPTPVGDVQLAFGTFMLFVSNIRIMANILLDGFLQRFPDLKVVSVESGAGWIPFFLEGLEYQIRECGLDLASPAEIFARQIYACSWFERKNFVDTVRRVGEDNILFETDFPHPTCLYPDAMEYLRDAILELTPQERRKVFSANAERVYCLDLG